MINTKIKFITVLLFLTCACLPIFAQEYVYVSVEKAEIKEGANLLASKVTEVKYGAKLIVLEKPEKGDWIKVAYTKKDESISGWIQSSNVTKKRIVKFLNDKSSSAKEQALAGKGSSIEKSNSNNGNFKSIK